MAQNYFKYFKQQDLQHSIKMYKLYFSDVFKNVSGDKMTCVYAHPNLSPRVTLSPKPRFRRQIDTTPGVSICRRVSICHRRHIDTRQQIDTPGVVSICRRKHGFGDKMTRGDKLTCVSRRMSFCRH